MYKFLITILAVLILPAQIAFGDTARTPVQDSEIFDRSLNRKFQSFVLYSDGTFERRATFYPKKNGKHWSTVHGTWAKQADGSFCFRRKGNYFHDRNSTRTFNEGSCVSFYKSSGGKLRMDMKHAGGAGFDGPFDVFAANDNVHFPSAKALKASGARKVSPAAFIKAAQGKSFAVNQWLGLSNFRPSRRDIFQMRNITATSAQVLNARKQEANAVMQIKGQSLCTNFRYKDLWAEGCGTIWQDGAGRFYIVSDNSGFAYAGGQLQ